MRLPTAALVATLAVAGCATVRSQMAQDRYLYQQMDALRYHKPIAELWPEVQRFLYHRGYPLVGADAKAVGQDDSLIRDLFSPGHATWATPGGGWQLQTGWGDGRRSYRADASPDPRGVRIVLTAVDEDLSSSAGFVANRDTAMELALAHVLAPDEAKRIEDGLEALEAGKGK